MADNHHQQQRRQQYSPFPEGHRPPRLRGHVLTRAAEELGLAALYHSPRDVKLLCLQRLVRLCAYGGSTLVLVAYLEALGISKTRIGLFMTLTLAGDVCISLLLTLLADGIGRRAILALGAALMAGSGVVFALCGGSYWALLAAAVLGVISPSGNEIGPFRAVEESIVAHLTAPASRGDVYAWYSLTGTAGTALGMVATGWAIHALQQGRWRWPLVDAYRAVFVGYAVLGVVKLLLTLMLSGKVESEKKQVQQTGERAPLLSGGGNGHDSGGGGGGAAGEDVDQGKQHRRQSGWRSTLLPEISSESRLVMVNLCILFALDSFASGLAPLSWVAYFFRSHYNLEEGKLGSVFFVTSIISAASMLLASALAKRFGNVNTMVFTHLPSAIFLALIPIPNEVHWSLLFLVLRACTQSMDVAPRSAFLAAIVLPAERTAIMGLVNVVKTSAQSLGPTLTGLLADRGLFWVAFVCAGSLKACYDLGLLAVFKGHEHEKAERERLEAERRAADEEGH